MFYLRRARTRRRTAAGYPSRADRRRRSPVGASRVGEQNARAGTTCATWTSTSGRMVGPNGRYISGTTERDSRLGYARLYFLLPTPCELRLCWSMVNVRRCDAAVAQPDHRVLRRFRLLSTGLSAGLSTGQF